MVTTLYQPISDSKYEEIKSEYYTKPDFNEVKKQFIKLYKGGVATNLITNYYVKDLMAKTKIYYNKWSIEDVFNYKPLVEAFVGKTLTNKKVYPDTMSDCKKIETAFRLGGKGIAGKPANFPIKTVDEILSQYNINDNYYDFSCGWSARLLGSLKNKINYFGTDPNYLLTDRLNQLANDYNETNNTNIKVDIRTQGSETFIPEWENTMGLAFSSPPYFYLEDYRVGNQSWHEGVSYQDWKQNYLKPTFVNIFYYLIQEGYFILNINNFKNYNLVEDSIQIAHEVGFKLIKEHKLNNHKRCYGKIGSNEVSFNDNSEKILVFIKDGYHLPQE